MKLRKILGLLVALAAILIAPTACIDDPVDALDDVLVINSRIPDFSVDMSNGERVSGADLRKQTSVIVFFHTSCPDCQQVLPLIQQLYDVYAEQGVAFALISRAETAPSIEAFWSEKNLSMPYSAQDDNDIYELFARRRVPRVYVTSSDGVIKHIFTDNPLPTFEQLEGAVQSQL